ncbi:NAD-dependent epimerase/dehydratase family protein [Natronogracilivirga saccharolytica]|uniref:NAD(P)-dependent oxidoreductase n=1 Tax=Natronogracilivirga saccharolytica TaxID=2812953 RepID=A0A8J7RTZ8_9BACT|nr:NAD-dependent epimerase/dehydratase family protein [Natronogracilivirga saccharolytica]MBP3193874.1 NAD(P)-dependent oxidoreductase [Natronogracilivirga saccharolytica]
MNTIEELDKKLSEPSDRLLQDLADLDGDVMILGVGGKMGPSLAALAQRTFQQNGSNKKVYGVSRFSDKSHKKELESQGIVTITADILKEKELQALPDVKYVIYLVGTKFGTSGNEHYAWVMNSYLPGRVAEKYRNSNIVVFSTGNVYPLVHVSTGGSMETGPTGPVGEYAQSCLGRERVFEYFSKTCNTPVLMYRLNYAIDLRYGVLLEVARSVYNEEPIDLKTGYANVIWQGDANEIALRCLKHCNVPPTVLNVTGPETISIRWLAHQFGALMDTPPKFLNEEEPTALLSNASKAHRMFGYPGVTLQQMIEWTTDWVRHDRDTLDKPTHFQQREGKF